MNLEKIIQKKGDEIEELKDALAMPRKHYKFIDSLTAEKIVEQKTLLIAEMAQDLGLPPEQLLETMYQREAERKAKIELDLLLAKEKKEAGGVDENQKKAEDETAN